MDDQRTDIVIIGSGFAGLGMAIRLRQAGIEDFVVLERAEEVGGVWRENRYPGCACDVASHLYSFSFALKPDWSRRFAPRAEILDYLKACATRFGVRPHTRFGCALEEARWDAEAMRWRLRTSEGRMTARVLVSGVGGLSEPLVPRLPGREAFAGRAFHSAEWPEDFGPDGQRDGAGYSVAVIGTGASAIQAVPHLQKQAARLTLFQRTPPWVVPRGDKAISERTQRLFARFPALMRAHRRMLYLVREAFGLTFRHARLAKLTEALARWHLRRQVADEALRRTLTPGYTMGCKRVLLSDDYYPALTRPNVTVVDGAATRLKPGAVVGPDGTAHPADAVVFCTGFRVTDFPFADHVYGRGGRSLRAVWGPSPEAHLGTAVAGFPNLFFLQGPNTGLGHNSVLLMIEAQITHILNALGHMRTRGLDAVEPRPSAQAAFAREVERQMTGTVWTSGGCDSWYLDESGRNSTLWPGSVGAFRRRVEPFDSAEYCLLRRYGRTAREQRDDASTGRVTRAM